MRCDKTKPTSLSGCPADGASCPDGVAAIMLLAALDPAVVANDWLDILVLAATLEGSRRSFHPHGQNGFDLLTPISTGAIIMNSWSRTPRDERPDDNGMEENEC